MSLEVDFPTVPSDSGSSDEAARDVCPDEGLEFMGVVSLGV
jgi:hypothetical protein